MIHYNQTNTMIRLSINTSKIDKTALIEGKTGKFLDITLMDNRDGQDKFGNDGFAVQGLGKERREAGERGPIIGNWKHVGTDKRSGSQNGAKPPMDGHNQSKANGYAPEDGDDIPF